jgi:hypothetical protein
MCVEAALDLTTPPLAILVLFTAGALGLRAALWATGGSGWAVAPWAVLLLAQTFYVLVGCLLARVPYRTYAALAFYGPLYAIAKVWYCAQAMIGAPREWVPTVRRSS